MVIPLTVELIHNWANYKLCNSPNIKLLLMLPIHMQKELDKACSNHMKGVSARDEAERLANEFPEYFSFR